MGGFQSDFRPPQLRGCPNFHFLLILRDFVKLIPIIATYEESHSGRKRPSRGSADGVRASVLFPPTVITMFSE